MAYTTLHLNASNNTLYLVIFSDVYINITYADNAYIFIYFYHFVNLLSFHYSKLKAQKICMQFRIFCIFLKFFESIYKKKSFNSRKIYILRKCFLFLFVKIFLLWCFVLLMPYFHIYILLLQNVHFKVHFIFSCKLL